MALSLSAPWVKEVRLVSVLSTLLPKTNENGCSYLISTTVCWGYGGRNMVNETGNGQCELVRQGSDEVGFLIPFGGCAKEKERSAQDPEFLEQLCHRLHDR